MFQVGLHQIELVRPCALWDSAAPEKENIATVIELIDAPDIVEALAQENLGYWRGGKNSILNPCEDPMMRALEEAAVQQADENFGREQAQNARDDLPKVIADARSILISSQLNGIMNLRDKHLAHSLSQTRREWAGPVQPMKYGGLAMFAALAPNRI